MKLLLLGEQGLCKALIVGHFEFDSQVWPEILVLTSFLYQIGQWRQQKHLLKKNNWHFFNLHCDNSYINFNLTYFVKSMQANSSGVEFLRTLIIQVQKEKDFFIRACKASSIKCSFNLFICIHAAMAKKSTNKVCTMFRVVVLLFKPIAFWYCCCRHHHQILSLLWPTTMRDHYMGFNWF